jgi:hypothetical protein
MFDESNKEIEERLQQDTEERLAERAESTRDWIEDWLGALSRTQERQITEMSLALPDTLEAWLDYRRQRQATFLQLVQGAQNGGADTQALRQWLMFPFEDAPQPYLKAREEMRVGMKEMAVSIDQTMTPAQRIHLLEELDDVIDDIEDLSEV